MTTLGTQYRGTREFLLVYSALIQAARDHRLLRYQEVALLIGVALKGHHMARQVGQVLGEISEDENAASRPMLSAIAVSEAGIPGEGFFNLARRLGRLQSTDAVAEREFLSSEQLSVYSLWGVSPNV